MEPYEVVNRFLMPADRVLGAAIDTLDFLGAYEPIRDTGYALSVSGLERVYRVMHKLEVIGRENVPEGGCIITPNHASWLDVEMVAVAAGRRVNFVAKSEFRHWPLLRQLIRVTDAIYVRRGGDPAALDEICEAVSAGKAVVMFPEGTIPGEEDVPKWEVEPDTHLLRGRSGAVRVALRTGVPIIPCGLSGTGRAFPPEAWPRMEIMPPVPRPAPVTVRFGAPIRLTHEGATSREQLARMTKTVMLSISSLVDHERNQPISAQATRSDTRSKLPPMASSRSVAKGRPKAPFGVLLLHGNRSYHESLDVFAPLLVRLDMPNRVPILHGPGSLGDGASPGQWAESAAAALQDLRADADRVLVIGISSGALIGLELAARHRDVVAAVVAVSPPAVSIASAIRGRLRPSQQQILGYARHVTGLLSFVKAPLLVLHATNDPTTPLSAVRRLSSRVASRDRELTTFRGQRGNLFDGTERREALREVESFMTRITGETAGTEPAVAPQRAAGRDSSVVLREPLGPGRRSHAGSLPSIQ